LERGSDLTDWSERRAGRTIAGEDERQPRRNESAQFLANRRPKEAGSVLVSESEIVELGSHESKCNEGLVIVFGDFVKSKVEPKLMAEREFYRSNYDKLWEIILQLITNADDVMLRQRLLEDSQLLAELDDSRRTVTVLPPDKK